MSKGGKDKIGKLIDQSKTTISSLFLPYTYIIPKIFRKIKIRLDIGQFLCYFTPSQPNYYRKDLFTMATTIETPIDGNKLTEAEKKQIVKDMTIDHIIAWCKKNNQLPWLSAKMEETVERKHYPYVMEKDANGKLKCKLDENGKRIVDYTKPPRTKKVAIGFMEIKRDFIDQFMPELKAPKKEAVSVSMADKLKAAMSA